MLIIKRGLWSWFLQRITGLLLVVGMVVHFITLHFESHEPITFERVTTRLQTHAWQIFDLTLLGLVLYHGLNGLWAVLLDFAPNEKVKNYLGWFVTLFGIATFIFGFWALMAYTK
ncbi:MAG: succinate dehydrogenase, hydrophobic membrane anchor protein [bacterium]|nr:succinate dehydrogenase, hydrophobic membrane anchor protein [bacterium]